MGSMSAYFSDMLGDRGLGIAVAAGGTVADFGAQIVYGNRRHRWNWAVAAQVLPYATGYASFVESDGSQVVVSELIERQTSRGFAGTASFPAQPGHARRGGRRGETADVLAGEAASIYDVRDRGFARPPTAC